MIVGLVTTQDHPKGPSYPVTDEWRERVRRRMVELEISKAELSRQVGVSDATITHLIGEGEGPRSYQSRHVPAIHKLLGWVEPDLPEESLDVDPVRDELLDHLEEMSDRQKQMLLDLARELTHRSR